MGTKKTQSLTSETMLNKRPLYKMPYSYFPDADERRWKRKDMYDIDLWLESCTKTCCGEEFLLPQKSGADAKHIEEVTSDPFIPPYYRADVLEGAFSGHPAFIMCPGPSLKEVNLGAFSGCLTIAVNSAGFEFSPYLWEMAECVYMNWFHHRTFDPSLSFLWNARTAFRFKWKEMIGQTHSRFRAAFIHKWEEEGAIPPRNPAPSTTAALVAAWKLGCDSAYVLGMDLAKPGGQSYIDSVPVTLKGAEATFEYQLKALAQFTIPNFTVYNGSPHSQKEDLPFKPIKYKEIEQIAISCSAVKPIAELILEN